MGLIFLIRDGANIEGGYRFTVEEATDRAILKLRVQPV
jgi:hypothetical protein